ncbi:hypothetical protein BDW67DRAFT_175300 [Aspergillus spinulosporus]
MAEQFVGRWVMQGLSWPLRKMICLAGLRIDVSVTPGEPDSVQSMDPREQVISVNVTLTGTPTGGMGGSTEVRKMDWSPLERDDFLFGLCQEQSHFVYPREGGDEHENVEKGKGVYPDVEMQTKLNDLRAGRFLRGEINEDGSESFWDLTGRTGGVEEKGGQQDGPAWVHTFVRNLRGNGWTAEQIWGFEIINGERCHTRRVVVANTKGQYVLARLVYKYAGEEKGSKK